MTSRLGCLALALSLLAQPAAAIDLEIKTPAGLPVTAAAQVKTAPVLSTEGLGTALPASSANADALLNTSAVPDAQLRTEPAQAVLPELTQTVGALGEERTADAKSPHAEGSNALEKAFDGVRASGIDFSPIYDFEPPTAERPSAVEPEILERAAANDEDGGRPDAERPSLSFGAAAKSSLLAIDLAKAIYGTVKVIRDTAKKPGERKNGSQKYWDAYAKGVAIDVTVKDENVFGRPTKITNAVTKKIGQLTRDDFRGIVPAFQLQLPIKQLRQSLIERLDENRAFWHHSDPAVSLGTSVRVIKFQSYIDLYKEKHGRDAVPEPEPQAPRAPVVLKPEGKLAPFARFLPRAMFLDVDMLGGPLSKELLADIAELQRTGMYFVAFSRKPYNAPGSLYETLVKNMGPAQMTAQMPNKFLAVTDNGAVISEFQKNGNIAPIDVDAFSAPEMDVLRDATRKALEKAGIPHDAVKEVRQPPIFIAGERFNPFRKDADERPKTEPRDPRIRYELIFPKTVDDKTLDAWIHSFDHRLKEQGLEVEARLTTRDDGTKSFVIQKTDLPKSMDRLYDALGDKYGLYLNSSDILFFTDDPELKKVNPRLDIGKEAGLKGPELVENVLGLMLGKARESAKRGSASRMIQFSGYRERYMSQFLVSQDAAEQHINFFSGHMVHSANDWLVAQLQRGKRPSAAEYEAHLRERWNRGIREVKPVGLPKGQRMERLLNASVRRGLNMYEHVVAAKDRGEILVGTEIPNFMVIEDFKRGEDGKLKGRYVVHTIFDFIALRPDPNRKSHATLVIYDFKTGPAKSRQKLEKDDQVRTYSLFAYERWVGQRFPIPYLTGEKSYVIDDAVVEFIYNLVQKPNITNYDRESQRKRIVRVFDAIERTEAKLLGVTAGGKPIAAKKRSGKAGAIKKGPAVKIDKTRPPAAGFETLTLPQVVPGIKIKREFAQQIIKGTKTIEYRTMATKPKAFVAIIQTFTDEEPGRPAEVVGFARIENVTLNAGQYEYHLSHVTPVEPYVVPNNKPGAIIWVKDVPVQGPKRLISAAAKSKKKST